MVPYFDSLRRCALFQGIDETDLEGMLRCLSARIDLHEKNAVIFAVGATLAHVGVVLKGRIQIEQGDYWGNRSILAQVGPGELFGEAFSCAGMQAPVGAVAAEATQVLRIDYSKIATTCTSACAFHGRLLRNMLRILAQKNVALTQKMEVITKRTTREKLLAYLSQQASRQGSSRFAIPFNRQELADYLAVDRSAMSSALAKMQAEGLLRYKKNLFELLEART